jgi:hypothetical protein
VTSLVAARRSGARTYRLDGRERYADTGRDVDEQLGSHVLLWVVDDPQAWAAAVEAAGDAEPGRWPTASRYLGEARREQAYESARRIRKDGAHRRVHDVFHDRARADAAAAELRRAHPNPGVRYLVAPIEQVDACPAAHCRQPRIHADGTWWHHTGRYPTECAARPAPEPEPEPGDFVVDAGHGTLRCGWCEQTETWPQTGSWTLTGYHLLGVHTATDTLVVLAEATTRAGQTIHLPHHCLAIPADQHARYATHRPGPARAGPRRPPHREAIAVTATPRYLAPTVTVEPVPDSWTPGNHQGGEPQFDGYGGHRRPDVFVTLNLRTGRLSAVNGFPAFDREQAGHRGGWSGPGWYHLGADLWMRGYGWTRTPTQLAWAGNSATWMLDAAGVNARLQRIRPVAQQLVDALDPVPGTGAYDWTLRATALEGAISGLAGSYSDHPREPVIGDRYGTGVISFAELIEADPDLIDPLWATMTDEQLDEVARTWTGDGDRSGKYIYGPTEQRLCAHFGWGGWQNGVAPDRPHSTPSFYVVHARIDLRRWRDTAIATATGLPTGYAAELLPDGYTGDDLYASSTDADLDRIAAAIDATAAYHRQVALVGTRELLAGQRARLRDRVRREAAAAAAVTADLQERLRAARAASDGLLLQVIGFAEQPEHQADGTLDYAALAQLGAMTEAAARARFAAVDEPLVPDETAELPAEPVGSRR